MSCRGVGGEKRERKPRVIDCEETGNICRLVLPTLFWFPKTLLTTNREETEENGSICSYLPLINSLVSPRSSSFFPPESPEEVRSGTEPETQTGRKERMDFSCFSRNFQAQRTAVSACARLNLKLNRSRRSFQLVANVSFPMFVCL